MMNNLDDYGVIIDDLLEKYKSYRMDKENQSGSLATKGIAYYHQLKNDASEKDDESCLEDCLEDSNAYDKTSNYYIKKLGDATAQSLYQYTDLVVDEFDYDGSPIYDDLDRETLAQMTDLAYEIIVHSIPQLQNMQLLTYEKGCYTGCAILRSLIREIIIVEIFSSRKKQFTNIPDCQCPPAAPPFDKMPGQPQEKYHPYIYTPWLY